MLFLFSVSFANPPEEDFFRFHQLLAKLHFDFFLLVLHLKQDQYRTCVESAVFDFTINLYSLWTTI